MRSSFHCIMHSTGYRTAGASRSSRAMSGAGRDSRNVAQVGHPECGGADARFSGDERQPEYGAERYAAIADARPVDLGQGRNASSVARHSATMVSMCSP